MIKKWIRHRLLAILGWLLSDNTGTKVRFSITEHRFSMTAQRGEGLAIFSFYSDPQEKKMILSFDAHADIEVYTSGKVSSFCEQFALLAQKDSLIKGEKKMVVGGEELFMNHPMLKDVECSQDFFRNSGKIVKLPNTRGMHLRKKVSCQE